MLNQIKSFKHYKYIKTLNKYHFSICHSINNELFIDILCNPKYSEYVKLSAINRHITDQQSYIKQLLNIQSVAAYVKHSDIFDNVSSNVIQQFDLNSFQGLVMTGQQFNKYFLVRLFIFINDDDDDNDNDNDFVKGINIYPKEFDPYQDNVGGILSFETLYCICDKQNLRPAKIPDKALVRIEYDQIKSNMIFVE